VIKEKRRKLNERKNSRVQNRAEFICLTGKPLMRGLIQMFQATSGTPLKNLYVTQNQTDFSIGF
jgi:hypothetical protein